MCVYCVRRQKDTFKTEKGGDTHTHTMSLFGNGGSRDSMLIGHRGFANIGQEGVRHKTRTRAKRRPDKKREKGAGVCAGLDLIVCDSFAGKNFTFRLSLVLRKTGRFD